MYNHVVTLPHGFRVCAAYMAVQLEQPASCRWGEELNMYNHVVILPHGFRVCAAYMAVQPVLYTAAGSTQPRQLGELYTRSMHMKD